MKVYGIIDGIVDNAMRLGDPSIHMFEICETGFLTEEEACDSLIVTGWTNAVPNYVKAHLGAGVWVRPSEEGREKDEEGYEVEHVRYIFEIEVADGRD